MHALWSVLSQDFDAKQWDWVVDCTGYKQSSLAAEGKVNLEVNECNFMEFNEGIKGMLGNLRAI